MKIKYDKNSDSRYITLSSRSSKIVRTTEVYDWLLVDYSRSGNIIGIEMLDVSKHPGALNITGNSVVHHPTPNRRNIHNVEHTFTPQESFQIPMAHQFDTLITLG